MHRKFYAFSILFGLSACDVGQNYSYASYTAACAVVGDVRLRQELRSIADNLYNKFGKSLATTVNREDSLSLVVDLPLVAGANSYRPNVSGQIILNLDSKQNQIGLVLVSGLRAEDASLAEIRKAIEQNLTHTDCRRWMLDTSHSVEM